MTAAGDGGDILIITPVRKRLGGAERLIRTVGETATACTHLILAADDDDPTYDALACPPFVKLVRGPRQTCPAWTNQVAREYGARYRALASFGDDQEPETPGWDVLLLGAIDAMGGTGIAYGDDTLQHENLPTAPVVSSDIPAALGWFMYPPLGHFFADNIWKEIGEGAGCLAYLPQVVIRHLHYTSGLSAPDVTYAEAAPWWDADEAAYRAWVRVAKAGDVDKVKALHAQEGAS